ncbi:Hypothetical protein SRAE_1000213100 [Strongyloides ratti]|uniref:Uncharacterized protein n=1 Tax=Strongyloides ratti TaxID=34506 RepID=A0A090L8Q1_STRRB|nr:Hypothetical protein SRAE_1000213100 [Strongyloides ratti]CEF63875.1 Hypothetical protein SRAE_1000213100 [Strongyloides ratti]
MPSFSFSGSNKSNEDDSNESFFSVGERLSMLPGVLEPRINLFQSANNSAYQTPKADSSIRVKEEVTPNSDQENKPTNGIDKSLINEFNYKPSNDFHSPYNKGSRIFSRVSNFLKNERITDPIEHNASIASIQSNFTVNPMFPSDIMGTAFDKARADIELIVDDFKKNVTLIRERDNIPTCKWDIKKHTLSEEFLKLRDRPKSKPLIPKKEETNSNDRSKTQNIVNSLLTTISQGVNNQATTNFSNCLPVSQPFLNTSIHFQQQQNILPQNILINSSQQQQVPTVPFIGNAPIQQLPVQTNDNEVEVTEEQMEAEEEVERKLLRALERIARVEGPLP